MDNSRKGEASLTIQLRDYQEEALDALWKYLRNAQGNPLLVLPTGSGKSVIQARLVQIACEIWDARLLCLTHVRELIQQNYQTLRRLAPDLMDVGIYSAGMGFRDTRNQILFAGIQSVFQRADELGSFDIVLVDEAHLIPKSGHGRYLTYLKALHEINPKVRVIGLTATPYRLDGGFLHKGGGFGSLLQKKGGDHAFKARIFDAICYDVPIERLVRAGHLCTLIAKRPQAGLIDTSNVKSSTGDFKKDELEKAAMAADVHAAVAEMAREGFDRRAWLIFACGIDHADQVSRALAAARIENKVILGDTPKDERDAIIKRYKAGDLRCIVNVGVLTTGFDAPQVDLLGLMRPTQSTGLYVQIMGRAMRTAPGKTNALVMDFGGNVERHGPVNKVKPKRGPKEVDGVIVKVCPACQAYCPMGSTVCDHCGAKFPVIEKGEGPGVDRHGRTAGTIDPLELEAPWLRVDSVCPRKHFKAGGGTSSLRIDYACGMRVVSEWVCLDHTGFARKKAERWWINHVSPGAIPATVEDALERTEEIIANKPLRIQVSREGSYDRIKRVSWVEAPTKETDGQTKDDRGDTEGAQAHSPAPSRGSEARGRRDLFRDRKA